MIVSKASQRAARISTSAHTAAMTDIVGILPACAYSQQRSASSSWRSIHARRIKSTRAHAAVPVLFATRWITPIYRWMRPREEERLRRVVVDWTDAWPGARGAAREAGGAPGGVARSFRGGCC